MYLNIGSDIIVRKRDIIGIFDMDNTTVSRLGKSFLPKAQRGGIIIDAAGDLPKSYVVTVGRDGETRVYFSSLASKILARRATTSII